MKNFQFSIFNFQKERGFTLIELMTALSIFAIVMTVSMGAILSIFNANRQSRSIEVVMTNLNLALESMAKEMRYGTIYHCGSGDITIPQNCPAGDTIMSFVSSEGIQTTYRLNGTSIEKQITGTDFIPVTAPGVVIDLLTFYTVGAGTSNLLQPRTIIQIEAHTGTKNRADFSLQTLVSQRALDI